MGLHRVGHDRSDLAAAAVRIQVFLTSIVAYFLTSKWLSGKESAANTGDEGEDVGLIPGRGRERGGG